MARGASRRLCLLQQHSFSIQQFKSGILHEASWGHPAQCPMHSKRQILPVRPPSVCLLMWRASSSCATVSPMSCASTCTADTSRCSSRLSTTSAYVYMLYGDGVNPRGLSLNPKPAGAPQSSDIDIDLQLIKNMRSLIHTACIKIISLARRKSSVFPSAWPVKTAAAELAPG